MPPDGAGTPSGTGDSDCSGGLRDAVLCSTGQCPEILRHLTSRDAVRYLTRKSLTATATKLKNLRGQTLLFRCLKTGFVTSAPALIRYQKARGIDPSRRELVGERPSTWIKAVPTTTCDQCGMEVKGNQWAFRQHQQTKRCLSFMQERT